MDGQFIASSDGRIAKIVGCESNGYIEVSVPARIKVGNKLLGSRTNSKHGHRVYGHHLVALAFLGDPPEGKEQINHKDLIKSNNRPNNLEWSDQVDNLQHAWDMKARKKQLQKYTEQQYREARKLYKSGMTIKDVAEKIGMTHGGCEYAIKYSRSYR